MKDLRALAARLDEAARTARATPQLSRDVDLTVDDAYAIQAASIDLRHGRGERAAGLKMGLTSVAKMRQVGVHEVIWGRLTDAMAVADGGTVQRARYVHPRAEPELAVVLRSRIDRPMSAAEALRHVDAVAPAIEIIDSRYEDFKFALPDVIADNASSSGFVIGGYHRPDVDVSNLGIVFEIDGRPAQLGSSAAILGHPARSLAAATRLATARGVVLEPGWIVMLGGATEAVPLRPGSSVRVAVQDLGAAGFSVEG